MTGVVQAAPLPVLPPKFLDKSKWRSSSFLLPRGRVQLLSSSGFAMALKRLYLLLASFTALVASLAPIGELESGYLVSKLTLLP